MAALTAKEICHDKNDQYSIMQIRFFFFPDDDLSELLVKSPAGSVAALTAKDICHDKETMCANGHHCCITVNAEWGCCVP